MRTLLVVDGNNLLVTCSEAMRDRELRADGVPTAALLGSINKLAQHVRMWPAEDLLLVVCWDGGRSVVRSGISPDYKAARTSSPESDARRPFGLFREFLNLAGVPQLVYPGWEGDDLIAAYCHQYRRSGCALADTVAIVSNDHDLEQLLGDGVVQVHLDGEVWDEHRVAERRGMTPRHLSMLMALAGDRGDGVAGVPGVGPKTSRALLEQAGHQWDAVLALLRGRRRPERMVEGVMVDGAEADAVAAETSRALVELRDFPYSEVGLAPTWPPPFRPTTLASTWLRDWLERYELATVSGRLACGSLWGQR